MFVFQQKATDQEDWREDMGWARDARNKWILGPHAGESDFAEHPEDTGPVPCSQLAGESQLTAKTSLSHPPLSHSSRAGASSPTKDLDTLCSSPTFLLPFSCKSPFSTFPSILPCVLHSCLPTYHACPQVKRPPFSALIRVVSARPPGDFGLCQ